MAGYSCVVPYNDLPHLPPSTELETKAVLKATIRARTALSDLKGAGRLIPNQSMLVRALLLQEARLSSEIENIVTTSDALYEALSRDAWEGHPHVKEVLRYSDAVWHGLSALKDGKLLTTKLFIELASIIKDTPMRLRSEGGTRIGNSATGEVHYTPPVGADLLEKLLDNVSDYFYLDNDVDPLVKLAVTHYQFEAIHPFHDGNGRTGRVLNVLWLVDQGLLESPVLYMSRAILQNKSDYYRGLRAVTEQARWEEWILYVLDVVRETADDTRRRIERIHEAFLSDADLVRHREPKIYSRELLELVYSQPYTRIQFLESAGIAKRQTASVYLKTLSHLGILEASRSGQNTLFLNRKLLTLLSG